MRWITLQRRLGGIKMVRPYQKSLLLGTLGLVIAACAQGAPPSNSRGICLSTYRAFQVELDAAARAKNDGDNVVALYHSNGASMNLDILLARGCCHYSDTCPAFVAL